MSQRMCRRVDFGVHDHRGLDWLKYLNRKQHGTLHGCGEPISSWTPFDHWGCNKCNYWALQLITIRAYTRGLSIQETVSIFFILFCCEDTFTWDRLYYNFGINACSVRLIHKAGVEIGGIMNRLRKTWGETADKLLEQIVVLIEKLDTRLSSNLSKLLRMRYLPVWSATLSPSGPALL